MAGIVLKGPKGEVIEYSGVTQMEIPYQDDDKNTSAEKFTRIESLNSYAVLSQGDGNYKVLKTLEYIPSNEFFMCGITDTDCQELGKEQSDGSYFITIFLTPKSLTVGTTYAAGDMY